MQIFIFSITHKDGDISMCQVYGLSIVKAMINLELINGCDAMEIDYIGSERTTDALNWDDCDTVLLSSIN